MSDADTTTHSSDTGRRAVYVRWTDVLRETRTWSPVDSLAEDAETEHMVCHTVGWLVRETDGYLWVSDTWSGDEVGPYVVIPRCLVQHIVFTAEGGGG